MVRRGIGWASAAGVAVAGVALVVIVVTNGTPATIGSVVDPATGDHVTLTHVAERSLTAADSDRSNPRRVGDRVCIVGVTLQVKTAVEADAAPFSVEDNSAFRGSDEFTISGERLVNGAPVINGMIVHRSAVAGPDRAIPAGGTGTWLDAVPCDPRTGFDGSIIVKSLVTHAIVLSSQW